MTSTKVGRTTTDAVLEGCLSWVDDNLDWFATPLWNEHFPPRGVPTQNAVELLLLTRVLARRPDANRWGHLLGRARSLGLAEVAASDFEQNLRDAGPNVGYEAWLVALLEDAAPPALRRAVNDVVADRRDGLVRLDWTPTQVVELDYILWLGGFPPAGASLDAVRGPAPYAGADASRLTESEGYALTHDLLYASDLAGHPLPLDAAAHDRVAVLVTDLLARTASERQLDLAAELLVCSRVAPGPGVEDARAAAWAAIEAAQLASGAVPGPPWDADVAAERSGAEASAYEFRTCYHTTLVAAMAAAVQPEDDE